MKDIILKVKIFFSILVIFGVITSGIKVSVDKRYHSELELIQEQLVEVVDTTQIIKVLYDIKAPSFLSENIAQEKIDDFKNQLDKNKQSIRTLEKKYKNLNTQKINSKLLEVEKNIQVTQDKFIIQNELNKIFSFINVKKSLSNSKFKKILTIYDKRANDSLQTVVTISLSIPHDEFTEVVEDLILVGQKELK